MHLRPPGQRIPTISGALCVELSAWAAPGSETVIPGSTLTQSGGGGGYSALQACSIVQPASPFREELVWTLKGHLARTKAWGSQPQHRQQHAGGKHALLTPLCIHFIDPLKNLWDLVKSPLFLMTSGDHRPTLLNLLYGKPVIPAARQVTQRTVLILKPFNYTVQAALDMLRMFLLHRSHLCS